MTMLRFTCLLLLLCQIPGLARAAEPTADELLKQMQRVAAWQIENPSKHAVYAWTEAPFYLGLFNAHQVSGDAGYLKALNGYGKRCSWGPGPRVTHADDHAILQSWLEVSRLERDASKRAPTVAHFPKVLAALQDVPPASITGGTFTWCWCDALFMSPPVWVHLSKVTGDPRYREWALREWWTCTDVLYDPEYCLYYRDNRFFTKRTKTGRKVFWARGNGWVVGGLIHVLDYLPEDHPDRTKFLGLYHDMMHALIKLQGKDGLWRSSLLDPEGDIGETSGTSFFTYAIAWGLNRGLLDPKTFRPVASRAMRALCDSIQPEGYLGFVQRVDDQPRAAAAKATEVYGNGAFLLAAAEYVRLLDPAKRREDLASFEGVTLPEAFPPARPRAYARFVPERKDDFAWENDLIAFRAYGPALREGTEDSGFDPWFKRVSYPVLDKWYLEDTRVLPYGKIAKSYHQDQGEGYDIFKVGASRGCGGIALWDGEKPHLSGTFIGYRVIDPGPERVIFELDYASEFKGKTLRETKRITLPMGERFFQCESKFTLDGQTTALPVVIGLKPQSKVSPDDPAGPAFAKSTGSARMWEEVDGLGVGTAVVLEPGKFELTEGANIGGEYLCRSRTNRDGYIRWFVGFAWEGQGQITRPEQWQAFVEDFAKRINKAPFADHSKVIQVHQQDPPADPMAARPIKEVSGATLIKPNGGWCWYQGPRVIQLQDGRLAFTTISAADDDGFDRGDLWLTAFDPEKEEVSHFELHDRFQSDDHDVAGLLERKDGSLLAVYGRHGNDQNQRWRISASEGDLSRWSQEKSFKVGAGYTYSNVYQLSDERDRIYNFHRGIGYNPNCTLSDDNGESWRYGWRLFQWRRADLKDNPKYTGSDGGRPYVRYASNHKDSIHFVTTEDHPRAYDNSIYHGFYSKGKLRDSSGKVVGKPLRNGNSTLKPTDFTKVFAGDKDHVAWTVDLELDKQGHPFTVFSVQVDGAKSRGKRVDESGNDHRFYYGRFDGSKWQVNEMAYAGTKLYTRESDYTGLAALDPRDPNTVVISTDAHPVSGKPLISKADKKRHHELFQGRTKDGGKTWMWKALTADSNCDNLRPVIPDTTDGKRHILWQRGRFTTFTDYNLDICIITQKR